MGQKKNMHARKQMNKTKQKKKQKQMFDDVTGPCFSRVIISFIKTSQNGTVETYSRVGEIDVCSDGPVM